MYECTLYMEMHVIQGKILLKDPFLWNMHSPVNIF